jgi:uncharacterized small protein (TIGR04563 family)
MSTNTRKSDARKVGVYLPGEILADVQAEAVRQDRSVSWLLQRAWTLAKAELMAAPTVEPAP